MILIRSTIRTPSSLTGKAGMGVIRKHDTVDEFSRAGLRLCLMALTPDKETNMTKWEYDISFHSLDELGISEEDICRFQKRMIH